METISDEVYQGLVVHVSAAGRLLTQRTVTGILPAGRRWLILDALEARVTVRGIHRMNIHATRTVRATGNGEELGT